MTLREWLIRLWVSLGSNIDDSEREEELRFHLESATEAARQRGDVQDATRHARLHAGSIPHTLELLRDQRGLPWLDDAKRDLRQSLRMFARARGSTALAVATLGLGIGGSTAVFSMLNSVVLKPLLYRDPEHLVVVWTDDVRRQLHQTLVSYPLYLEWKQRNRSFSDLAFSTPNTPVTLSGFGEAERVDAARATASLFGVLGVSPMIGRTYSADEERQGDRVALVSRGLAERRFGSVNAALGGVFFVDGEPTTVIGVLPTWFGFPRPEIQIWRPLRDRRGQMVVVGRLREGTALAQARQEMAEIGKQLATQYPDLAANPDFPGFETNLVALEYHVTGRDTRLALWILVGASVLMMLIACTNVGTLMLARAAARHRELALRAALGATRARLVRQMLIEAVALASAGGLLGVASAFWILQGLVALAPPGLPRLETIVIDRFVLTFTIALAVFCSVILGAVTASRAQKLDLEETLRKGGRGHGTGARRPLQHALIVGEVALTLALVCGAGLLIRSLGEVRQLSLGFETSNTLLFRTVVPNEFSSSQRRRFFEEAVEQIHRLSGVRAVGVVSNIFPTRAPDATILVEAEPDGPRGRLPVLDDAATPGFFSALRVPLRKGRYFDRSDSASGSHVAIVNERFAREFWGDDDPVGRRFQFLDKRYGDAWVTVVGMVADMHRNGLEQVPYPQVFVPFAQSPSRGADLVVHTDTSPLSLANSVTRTIAAIDPSIPIYRLSTLEQRLDEFQENRRFLAWVLSLFASIGILLAAIGMYGVVRYDVTQRTQEIGVRIAVGASRGDVVALVLRNGLALTGAGLVIGELTAVALAGLMTALVFGISPRDPVTLVLAPLLLLAVGVAACLEPAWRALRVDPLHALKAE